MSRIIGSRRNEPSRDDEVKEILRNDARVVLDFSCVTSFDNLGLEAALGLVETVRSSGGRVSVGDKT